MRIFLLVALAGCTDPVVTTPAQFQVTKIPAGPSFDVATGGGNAMPMSAVAVSTDPVIVRFVALPPGTDCHSTGPEVAQLTVLLSSLPPLVEGPTPAEIAIDVAADVPGVDLWNDRSHAGLYLFQDPTSDLPMGTLIPSDDAALHGELNATATAADGTTKLRIWASYAIDQLCD